MNGVLVHQYDLIHEAYGYAVTLEILKNSHFLKRISLAYFCCTHTTCNRFFHFT